MKNARKTVHLGFVGLWLILGGWLSGCSETLPTSDTTEKSLAEILTLNNQSNVRVRTVRIEGAWNDPEVVGTERVDGSAQNIVSGPDYGLDQSGAVMVSWQTTQYPNSPNGIPGQFKTTVLRKNADSTQWLANSPIPVDATSNTTQPILQVHSETGITYATWFEFGTSTTFVRRYNPISNTWGNLHPLKTSFAIQIFLDKQGDATIMWPSFTNTSYELHALYLSSSDSLSTVSTLSRSISGSPKHGYVTNAGTTRVFWFEGGMSFSPAQLWYADYNSTSGWGEAEQISLGSLSIEFPLEKLIALYDETSQTTVITFSSNLPLDFNIPANIYELNNRNGSWSSPGPVDPNPQGANFGADYATNHNGQLVIVWNEMTSNEAETSFFYYVKAKQYSAQTGWSSADTISDPLPLIIGNNSVIQTPGEYPQVAMNNLGEITIVWFDINPLNNIDIFANHYSPVDGWGTQELLVRTELTSEFIRELDVQLNDQGETFVMWREVVRDTLGATHRIMLSQHKFGGTLVSPPTSSEPLPTTPSPAELSPVSFSAPVNVWNNAGQDNISVNVRGPLIANAPSSNEIYLSLINNRYYNSLTQLYKQGENIVLTQGGGSTWMPVSLPAKAVAAVEPAQLVFASDGTAFLIWLENRDLYLSNSTDKQSWSTPVLIDNNVGRSFLLPATAGNMNIVWQSFDNDSTIHLRRYFSGNDLTAGLQSVYSSNFSDRLLVTSPISDAQGNVSVAWLSTTVPQEITLSTFNDTNQWQTSSSALSIGAQAKTKFQLAHSSANTYILIAVSAGTKQLFASQYSEAGGWLDWRAIDQNQGTTNTIVGLPQVRENIAGQVMVLWIEKIRNTNGLDAYRLLSNTLSLVNAVPTWSTPQLIETTFHPSLRVTPILQFADDGSAMAAWIETSITQQVLRFNQYTPTIGWSDQSVDLINYTGPNSGYILNLNMILTSTGNPLVTWQQLIRNNLGGEFHIWTIEGAF